MGFWEWDYFVGFKGYDIDVYIVVYVVGIYKVCCGLVFFCVRYGDWFMICVRGYKIFWCVDVVNCFICFVYLVELSGLVVGVQQRLFGVGGNIGIVFGG